MLINIIIWSIAYAPLSAQSLGTAARYKLQILPFILVFIYLNFYYKKMCNKVIDIDTIRGIESRHCD